jgi:hypothetical protein
MPSVGLGTWRFDYEAFFHLEGGAPLYLQLENNLIVSMIDTFTSGSGHSSYLHELRATTFSSGVIANTLVIGTVPGGHPIQYDRFSSGFPFQAPTRQPGTQSA